MSAAVHVSFTPIMPKPPASETARANDPPAAGVIDAFKIGWRRPHSCVSGVLSIDHPSIIRVPATRRGATEWLALAVVDCE
jgi:hypothetical protein